MFIILRSQGIELVDASTSISWLLGIPADCFKMALDLGIGD